MRIKFPLILIFIQIFLGQARTYNFAPKVELPVGDVPTLKRQQEINELFNVTYIADDLVKDIYGKIDLKYDSQQLNYFKNTSAANTYMNILINRKNLPKGHVFKPFQFEHYQESEKLFDFLISAQNYEVLYRTAFWLKGLVNEGLYLFTIYKVFVHSPLTNQYILPPIYEVYPWYFFSSKVINQAQRYHQLFLDDDYLHIEAEYTTEPMSYFTEDVGLNAYYYYFNLYYPSNIKSGQKDETYYFFYQQFLARYYLERLSNNLGRIPNLNWHKPFKTPFNPELNYHNGNKYSIRDDELIFNQSDLDKLLEAKELIDDAVGLGYENLKNNTKVSLNIKDIQDLIYGNPEKSMEVIGRQLLGSAMENIETSPRDPAFYIFYKNLFKFYQKYAILTRKSYIDYISQAVKVKEIRVGKLVTYFDTFTSEISHSCILKKKEYLTGKFKVFAKQKRLNFSPFNYTVRVDAGYDFPAVVKVFLGPKYDETGKELDIQENRFNFVLIDMFDVDLKEGYQNIHRNSHDITLYAEDQESHHIFAEQISKSYRNNLKYDFMENGSRRNLKWPKRFLLPKGSPEGVQYQLLVLVFGTDNPKLPKNLDIYHQGYAIWDKTLGYPLDEVLYMEGFKVMPNKLYQDVTIYHDKEIH